MELTKEVFLDIAIKFYKKGYEDCQEVVATISNIPCFNDTEKMKKEFLKYFDNIWK